MRLIDADALKESLKKLKAEGTNRKYVQGLQDAIDGYFPQIIDDMPTIEAEPDKGWISVKDRLPENDGLYIVCKTVEEHQISFEARWKGNKWWLSVVDNNRLDYVTHWMPLPKPPKGE